MGTRSLTHITDNDKTIVTIYRQFDGYPTGMGQDLQEFLKDRVVGNGIPMNPPPKFSNGMGELAAQLVTHLKIDNPSGNVYLMLPDTEDVWEEYTYRIWYDEDNNKLMMSIGDIEIDPNDADMEAIERGIYDDDE